MANPFTHLHNHSHFSLLDASAQIEPMCKRIKDLGMNAVALTDHGNMSGAVQLSKYCHKEGIKPIIGCELYVATRGHTQRIKRQKDVRDYNHLVVLAMNREGYQNLCRLVSAGYTDGFYYRPRVDRELLKKWNRGLMALTACPAGSVPQAIMWKADHELKTTEEAMRDGQIIVEDLQELFRGNLRLEMQDHGIDFQPLLNVRMVQLSKLTGVPLIWTNDSHFLVPEDYQSHRALTCIPGNRDFADESKHVYKPEHHLRSEADMRAILKLKNPDGQLKYGKQDLVAMAQAFDETAVVANLIEYDFGKGQYYFPEVVRPDGVNLSQMFHDHVMAGFEKRSTRFIPERYAEYIQRLAYEMQVIERMGFESYFLIVADIVNWAKDRGILVGPGRGSAAGSLVSYCLGITDLDPLYFGLLFERFLNPERISMPDIDLDFPRDDRQAVIEHVVQQYGKDNVAQIITFGTLGPRAAIQDLGRVFKMTIPDSRAFAGLIPNNPGKPYDFAKTMAEIPEFANLVKSGIHKTIYDLAVRLEDCNRHSSLHAAGIVITPTVLTDHVPLYVSSTDKEKHIAAAYDMRDLEEIGLIKIDLLGIKDLDKIGDCLALIKQRQGIDIVLNDIPLDDPKVYTMFARGDTKGVFQFESRGMRNDLVKLKPDCFEHLVAMNALYRPGPNDSGMTAKFIARKNGNEPVEVYHPDLKEILDPTYGVIVYQEQVMKAVQKLTGYSLAQADYVRKAMGKKDPILMDKELKKFVDAAVLKGYAKADMESIAQDIKKFARYGFNRAHAAAYAYIGYQTAWLRCYYPLEFMAATLTVEAEDGKIDKITEYIGDCKIMGIPILQPDVLISDAYFVPEGKGIRYGLAALRGVGPAIVQQIVDARKSKPFTGFPDFLHRSDLNKTVIEALISAGATEGLSNDPGGRATHFNNYQKLLDLKKKRPQAAGQIDLFELLGEKDRLLEGQIIPTQPWDLKEMNRREKDVLGLWLTHHPLDSYKNLIEDDLSSMQSAGSAYSTEVIVVLNEGRVRMSARGKKFCVFQCEDLSAGTEDAVMWGDEVDEISHMLKVGAILKLKGRVSFKDNKFRFTVKEVTRLDEEILEDVGTGTTSLAGGSGGDLSFSN